MYPESNKYQNENKFILAAQTLRNRHRQQVFALLSANNNLSFNDLMKILNISRQKLAYHLQIMIQNNIITNFYDKRENIKDHSFYELTAFGQELRIEGGLISKIKYTYEENKIETKEHLPKKSANFRTIRYPKYKAFDKVAVKINKSEIKPLEGSDLEYNDTFLDITIKRKTKFKRVETRWVLPTPRQYYKLYNHPFKVIGDLIYRR